MLLNLKDLNKIREGNFKTRVEDKGLNIESGMEKYNKAFLEALNAPVPDIALHYNEVLLRACPAEIKTRGNLIYSIGDNDLDIAKKLNSMSHNVDQVQEILLVGSLITAQEREAGLRPGRMAKIKLANFRNLTDQHLPGMIETEYTMPVEKIDGNRYMILDKRDILYTRDKHEAVRT